VHGRDLYWRVHGGVSDSSVKPATLARTIGRPFTTRNLKSLRTLVTKLEAPLP
jgi:hypothetical protein